MFAVRFDSFQEMFMYLSLVYFGYLIHMFFVSPYKDSTRYRKFSELYSQVHSKEQENHNELYNSFYGFMLIYMLAFYHTCKIIVLSNIDETKKSVIKKLLSPIKLSSETYLQPCYIENTMYYIPIKIGTGTASIDILSINSDFYDVPFANLDKVLSNVITKTSEPIRLSSLVPEDFGANHITVNYLTDEGISMKTFGKSDEIILN
jgi:hypothetical protein